MDFASVVKAFLEVGMLGLCAIMMIIVFYENHKRANLTDEEKNKLIKDNFDVIQKQLSGLMEDIQDQNNKLIERQELHWEKENER